VDEQARTVTVETDVGTHELGYENLVVAVGSVSRVLPIPGLAEHGLGFHDLADAIRLRNHVVRRLETAAAVLDPADVARELTFVFVGAGYAGVEALAELHDLVTDALRYYPTLKGAPQRWVLVDAAPKILAEIPTRLGEYAAELLGRRAIEIRVSTRLESAEAGAVTLSDGSRIPTRTLVWTAGVRPRPAVGQFGLPLDERGRIRVDSFLRVEGRTNVWALGDAARVPNAATPDHPDPPTSQHALRQARRLARNLTGTPKPYRFRMLGQVATLGRYKGIAELPGHIRLRGFVAWWVTRSYHLYQVPFLSRKLRIVIDWTVALFFRRDIAEFSLLQEPHRLGE
jgi:NADH dehydrogenase